MTMTYQELMKQKYEALKSQINKTEYLKPKKGETYDMRIVPYAQLPDKNWSFFYEQCIHFLAGTVVTCPVGTAEANNLGNPLEIEGGQNTTVCPVCDWVKDNMESDDIRRVAVAGQMLMRRQYTVNILLMKDGVYQTTPILWRVPASVMMELLGYLTMKGYENLVDPMKGRDLRLEANSKGPLVFQVEYKLKVGPEPTPIAATKEKVLEILKRTKKLDRLLGEFTPLDEMKETLTATLKDREFVQHAVSEYQQRKQSRAKERKDRKS